MAVESRKARLITLCCQSLLYNSVGPWPQLFIVIFPEGLRPPQIGSYEITPLFHLNFILNMYSVHRTHFVIGLSGILLRRSMYLVRLQAVSRCCFGISSAISQLLIGSMPCRSGAIPLAPQLCHCDSCSQSLFHWLLPQL